MSDLALTIYGVTALTFMMTMYALERRHRVGRHCEDAPNAAC
jgi:hypothetical protein